MNEVKIYQVGGSVRDEVMGRKSNDIDFSVESPSYEEAVNHIKKTGQQVYVEYPKYYTFKSKHPSYGTCDYVWCRKDGPYLDGRRPSYVEPGTIYDDLARRDFTINAIAKNDDGYFDPFGGLKDIEEKRIVCVGDTEQKMREDGIRIVRAIRFSINFHFDLSDKIRQVLNEKCYADILASVHINRVYDEVKKIKWGPKAFVVFMDFPIVYEAIFRDGLSLGALPPKPSHKE